MSAPYDDGPGCLGAFIFTVILLLFFGGCTAVLRNYSTDSCRDRGGIPVTPSWFSQQPWDVHCIEFDEKVNLP